MQKGAPLVVKDILPFGLTTDDVLVMAAALGVFMIIWSIGTMLFERDRVTPRLKMIAQRRDELKGALLAPEKRKRMGNEETLTFIRRIVAALKLLQQHQVDTLQQKLIRAGYRSKDAIVVFAFAKLITPFAGLALGFLLCPIDWNKPFAMDQGTHWLGVIITAYACARLPELIVANARGKRQHAIRRTLPDALDLMMICAEAGLSLAAALDRVAKEFSRINSILAEEFSLTSVELGFLPDRATALKNLAERVDTREVRGFVNVIVQTEKYGTPIAQALRVLAKEYRTERMLQAEQKATRLPAIMTVPMIVFILPTLFVIVMAPAALSIMDNL